MAVTVDAMERHNEHTTECLLFWELLLGSGSDPAVREKVMLARLAIGEFVERRKTVMLAFGNPLRADGERGTRRIGRLRKE